MPARVLRACAAGLGDPRRKHLAPWDLVEAIDEANGNKAARSIYRRLYVPLCNYTVHASGGTLLRHVHRKGSLRWRPTPELTDDERRRRADALWGAGQNACAPHIHSSARAPKTSEARLYALSEVRASAKLEKLEKLEKEERYAEADHRPGPRSMGRWSELERRFDRAPEPGLHCPHAA